MQASFAASLSPTASLPATRSLPASLAASNCCFNAIIRSDGMQAGRHAGEGKRDWQTETSLACSALVFAVHAQLRFSVPVSGCSAVSALVASQMFAELSLSFVGHIIEKSSGRQRTRHAMLSRERCHCTILLIISSLIHAILSLNMSADHKFRNFHL